MFQEIHEQITVRMSLPFPIPSEDGASQGKGEGGGGTGFFITCIPPHTPIKRSTLMSWAKTGLSLSGVDMERFTPHSMRAASTSKAKL